MRFTVQEIAQMTDLSAVRAEGDETEIRALADAAKKYGCLCVSTLPWQTPLIKELLAGEADILIDGVVSFPSGGAMPGMKRAEARDLIQMGCDELDMVINIGLLRSGYYRRVLDDIKGVVEVAGSVPVKVILECHYLSDDEIRRGCELCVEAGAAFVKTSTGWAPTGATLENVALIKSCVGNAIGVKAAGGIRELDTLMEMYRLGARRFGLGLRSAKQILEQCAARSGETLDV